MHKHWVLGAVINPHSVLTPYSPTAASTVILLDSGTASLPTQHNAEADFLARPLYVLVFGGRLRDVETHAVTVR